MSSKDDGAKEYHAAVPCWKHSTRFAVKPSSLGEERRISVHMHKSSVWELIQRPYSPFQAQLPPVPHESPHWLIPLVLVPAPRAILQGSSESPMPTAPRDP